MAEDRRPASATVDGDLVVAAGDDLPRLRTWLGEAALTVTVPPIDLAAADARGKLRAVADGDRLAVLLTAAHARWRQLLAPALHRAGDARVCVLRGLRGAGRVDELVEVAAEAGLEPADARGVTVDGLPGVDLTLRRASDPMAWAGALLAIAGHTTGQTSPERAGPRVAIHGSAGAWVDGLAHAVGVDAAWIDDPAALRRASPDVVLLGPDAPAAPSALEAVDTAVAAGALVLSVGAPSPGWADRVTALVPPGPAPVPFNAIAPAGRDAPIHDVTDDLAADAPTAAATLVRLGAAGTPVVAPDLPDAVAGLLAPPVAELLRHPPAPLLEAEPADAGDPRGAHARREVIRQRHGVRLRRAVLRAHEVGGWWDARAADLGLRRAESTAVSAVCATRRPEFWPHVRAQLTAQTHRPLECVLVLHGPAWEGTEPDTGGLDVPITTVRVDPELPLGAALNRGVAAASGAIVTKIDDDDWYGPDHVADLVAALETGGATLAGKGAEFYYLAGSDLTVQRVNDRYEAPSRLIAGNTLTIRRADLDAVGGFHAVDRTEDRRLVADVQRWGGVVYRTHGFGHVVQRHDRGHTWHVADAELAEGARWIGDGLALATADCAADDRPDAPDAGG
ncbi:glycosyltransferase [Egibacter rhizosphaerae]|uniref:Glycosyltransferase n=1 Tax=Egibacter rhizosphaerae TaxID=1670831 RepID=A0A411YHK2_9ACTN|nr:glycosyltransferase family 2 protein [Egibacter rhizosphaerae]QBI20693.1 glycosyltransferase [Egibacter rhizosphaerae]